MTPTVLISDPNGFNMQRVPINGASRSWAVNAAGRLSAEAMSDDLAAIGLNDELRGRWIVCQHDDAGPWGGVISEAMPSGDGTTEIAAEDWGALFARYRLPNRVKPLFGPAGTLALAAISYAVLGQGMPIRERYADDIGLSMTLNLDRGDLRTKLDGLARDSGQEWWITTDPYTLGPKDFRWGFQGRDLTGSVQLIEGRHLTTDWRAPTSIEPVINDLVAFPTNDRYAIRQSIRVENAESIAAVGLRQGSAGIAGGSHGIHIRPRAIGLVNELAQLGRTIQFDLVNVDGCFSWFRDGDRICLLLPRDNSQLTVRVLARSLDESEVMGVSGVVLTRRVAA